MIHLMNTNDGKMTNKEGIFAILGLLSLIGFLLVTFWYHNLYFHMIHRNPVSMGISEEMYWMINLSLATFMGVAFLLDKPIFGAGLGLLFGVLAQLCYIQYLSWVDETSMVEMLLPPLLPFLLVRFLQLYIERKFYKD